MQVAEARIPGPEVVERDSHPGGMQLRQRIVGPLRVAQQRGFGDLDFEPVRGKAGYFQRIANLAQHVALMELLRREIDRNADGLRPLHGFHAGLAQDPAAEIDDQAHVFGDRNDIDRRHRAAHRMIPAQQRLAGGDLSRLEIDQRLVEQLELLVRQRLAQVEFQDTARLDDLRQFLAEEAEGTATVGLGAV